MAIGNFVRVIAQVVVPIFATIVRALPTAYAEALQNAKKTGTQEVLRRSAKAMSKSEAMQILNVTETEVASSPEIIQKVRQIDHTTTTLIVPRTNGMALTLLLVVLRVYHQNYEKYFAANDVTNGGSFYLQSKVYRAKEMLDEFIKEKEEEEEKKQQEESSSSSSTQQPPL